MQKLNYLDEDDYDSLYKDDFAITITLNPELYRLPANEQVQLTRSKVIEALNLLCANDYVFTMELTKQGNVHYHAYVVFLELTNKSYKEKLIREHSHYFGHIKIKRVYDAKNWMAYMYKCEYNV